MSTRGSITFVVVLPSTLKVVRSHSKKTETLVEKPWQAQTLWQVLAEIKPFLATTQLNIVLDTKLANIFSVKLEADQDPTDEEALLARISPQLPLPSEDLGIDFRTIETVHNSRLVQVFAVRKGLLSVLGRASKRAGLEVATISTSAHLIGLQLSSQSKASVVIWNSGDERVVAAYWQHVPLIVSRLPTPADKHLESLISLVDHRYELPIKLIIYPTGDTMAKRVAKSFDLPGEEKDLNPFEQSPESEQFVLDEPAEIKAMFKEGMEEKDDKSEVATEKTTPDPDVPEQTETMLEDEIDEQLEEVQPEAKAPTLPLRRITQKGGEMEATKRSINPPQSSNRKLYLMALIVGIVIVMLLVGGLLVSQRAQGDRDSGEILTGDQPIATPSVVVASPSPESTQSAEPNPAEIDLTTISVQVLNGSGVPGLAGKVADVLTEAGIEDVETGNAANYNFETTVIQVKSDQAGLYSRLEALLRDTYQVEAGDAVSERSEFDAIITVGKQ